LGALLHKHQMAKYTKIKAVASHLPHRFAVALKIVSDLITTKDALVEMTEDKDWAEAVKNAKNPEALLKSRDRKWWVKLRLVEELLQPVSDAIHQLEADYPMFSQVMRVWILLMDHATRWQQVALANPDVPASFVVNVVRLFRRRLEKHLSAAAIAAYMVDPINWVDVRGEGVYRPPQLPRSWETLAVEEMARLAGTSVEEARREVSQLRRGEWPQELQDYANELATWRRQVPAPDRPQKFKVQVASAPSRANLYTDAAAVSQFGNVAKVARRLISMHATTGACERNWHAFGLAYSKQRAALNMSSASKMVAIRMHHGQISLADKRIALLVMLSVCAGEEGEETWLASEIKGDAVMVAPTVEEEDEEEEEEVVGRAAAQPHARGAKRVPEQTEQAEEPGRRTRTRN